jgi:hypothetical protein
MAYQAVNRVVPGNSDADKTWQTAVVRNLTEEMSSPPLGTTDRVTDKERVSSGAPDQSDATSIIQRVAGSQSANWIKLSRSYRRCAAFS